MIDKSIRQWYDRGSLVRKGPPGTRPGFRYGPHSDPSPAPSGPSGPPGGGGGHHSPPSRPAPSRPAPSRPAPSPHRDPTPVAPTAVAPPSVLSRPTPSTTIGPSLHGGPTVKEALEKGAIKKMIRDQALEKMDYIPDDLTQLNLNIFGEKLPERDIDDVMNTPERDWTIEDKRIIEDWEKDQDWDKVKKLADRGHSSDDIQKAMDKGLLLKQDAIRRQGLIERGLAMIKPETRLESSLLDTVKKTFDPRRLATNFALRKMGLSWLNPLMGLASLFGLPQKAKSMIASRRTPAFDPAKARQLGLYADRVPTDTTKYARVGEPYRQPDLTKQIAGKGDYISKSIAKFTGKGDDRSGIKGLRTEVPLAGQHFLPGMHPFSGTEPPLTQEQINNMYKLKLAKAEQLTLPGMQNMPSGYPWSMQGEGASPESWITKVAKGGRVDKALGGRVRDI